MANFIGLKDFETVSSKDYKTAMLQVEAHLADVLGDDVLLAWIMGGGKTSYINVFMREFRSLRGVDREVAEMLWTLFLSTWRQRYPHQSPKAYLDALEMRTPPTEKEIDDAWEFDSASSDDARRYFGGGVMEMLPLLSLPPITLSPEPPRPVVTKVPIEPRGHMQAGTNKRPILMRDLGDGWVREWVAGGGHRG